MIGIPVIPCYHKWIVSSHNAVLSWKIQQDRFLFDTICWDKQKKKQASFTIMHRKHSLCFIYKGPQRFWKTTDSINESRIKKPAKIILCWTICHVFKTLWPINEAKPYVYARSAHGGETGLYKMLNWLGLSLSNAQGSLYWGTLYVQWLLLEHSSMNVSHL